MTDARIDVDGLPVDQSVREQIAVEKVLRRYCSGTAEMLELADRLANGEVRVCGAARLLPEGIELEGVAMTCSQIENCAAWLQGSALVEGMGWAR
jgi:hypothetical protein